jgi:hypothetical protein
VVTVKTDTILTWHAPRETGGSPVTGYTLRVALDNTNAWTTAASLTLASCQQNPCLSADHADAAKLQVNLSTLEGRLARLCEPPRKRSPAATRDPILNVFASCSSPSVLIREFTFLYAWCCFFVCSSCSVSPPPLTSSFFLLCFHMCHQAWMTQHATWFASRPATSSDWDD